MSTPSATQIKKAIGQYETAFNGIADLTRALKASADGETARRAGTIDYAAEFLFKRLHELHDGRMTGGGD